MQCIIFKLTEGTGNKMQSVKKAPPFWKSESARDQYRCNPAQIAMASRSQVMSQCFLSRVFLALREYLLLLKWSGTPLCTAAERIKPVISMISQAPKEIMNRIIICLFPFYISYLDIIQLSVLSVQHDKKQEQKHINQR